MGDRSPAGPAGWRQWLPASIGLAAAAAALFIRRTYSTMGGPVVVVRTDGVIVEGRRKRYTAPPARQMVWRQIGQRRGAGDPAWALAGLSLAPSGAVVALDLVENFPGGADGAVQILATGTGAQLFFSTDNGHPDALFAGDDADVPPPLATAQAAADAQWQADQEANPGLPRPVLTARFDDVAADGTLVLGGWTSAGAALMIGQTRLRIIAPDVEWLTDERWPWWGVAGPGGKGPGWAWLAKGAGTPPAEHMPIAPPAAVLDLAVAAGALQVAGVQQTDGALQPGVAAVSGPWA